VSTVLITGANRGLGLEFARQYAGDGWNVVACCRAPDKAKGLQALAALHPTLRIESLDVEAEASVKALANRLKDMAIDLLINNAGVFSGTGRRGVDAATGVDGQSFGTIDSEAWAKVLRINTIAPLMIAQNLAPQVARSKGGKIINITSRMGSLAEMGNGDIAYRSSKAALNAAMRAITQNLQAQGIATANLHPGWVQTDMGGKSAPLSPEQSVSGMRRVIQRLSLKDTGQFLAYDGEIVPW
jgi:NAD(P)-dependent dehydrogenase (short-subunit alcohol dehydrogenase family)